MAIHYSPPQEHLDNQAARIGAIFELPSPGAKIVRDGVELQHLAGDTVLLTVKLIAQIPRAEAGAIMAGLPLGDTL